MTFDLDSFIAECLAAAPDQAAVTEVVKRAVSDPTALEETFTRTLSPSNLGILHYSDHLTVQHVVFPPAFRTGIHDHLTWAVIGTWGGYEDNHLFAREGNTAVPMHVERCESGQVISLGADAIHEVHVPLSSASAAIHVYGGPLFDQPRHQWNPTEAVVDDSAALDHLLAELRASGYLSESR